MHGVDISDERLPEWSAPLVGSEPLIDLALPAPSSPTLKAGRLGAHHTGFVASCSPPHQRVQPYRHRAHSRADTKAVEGALPLRPAIGECIFDATVAFRYLPNSVFFLTHAPSPADRRISSTTAHRAWPSVMCVS